MTIGIIVARFQSPYLHQGHSELIKFVQKYHKKVVIFLGSNETRLTKNNPLDFESRKAMINERFPEVSVYRLSDQKYNHIWDTKLDKMIENLYPDNKVILYGSRDSFINNYKGKNITKHFSEIPSISATNIRSSLHGFVQNERLWREGVIYASGHKYPTSYQAVDIAPINFDKNEVLLGKKPGENLYRFIGGFVDVGDESLESASKREVREECGDIETDDYRYIGSFRIDDWRYRKEQDKIMSAFFCCHYIFGHPKAHDDISELKWFSLSELNESHIEPEHHNLFNALKKYISK